MAVKTPTVRYKTRENFEIYPVNGVFGGPSSRGDIVCRFFLELVEPPDKVELEAVPEAPAAYREKQPLSVDGIRQFQTGIILNPEQAVVIADWLRQHAMTAIAARGAGQKPEIAS